jgi:hypothetical protein
MADSNTMIFSDGTNTVTAASLAALKTAIDGIANKGYVASETGTNLVITAGTANATGESFGSEVFTATNGATEQVSNITIAAADSGKFAYSKISLTDGATTSSVLITSDDAAGADNTDLLDALVLTNPFSSDITLSSSSSTDLTLTAANVGTAHFWDIFGYYFYCRRHS